MAENVNIDYEKLAEAIKQKLQVEEEPKEDNSGSRLDWLTQHIPQPIKLKCEPLKDDKYKVIYKLLDSATYMWFVWNLFTFLTSYFQPTIEKLLGL